MNEQNGKEFYPEYDGKSLKELAQALHETRQLLDYHDSIKKELQKRYDHIRIHRIPDAMNEADITNVTYEDIGRVTVTGDIYASIPAAKKPDAYQWLRDNGYGDLIQETVNSSTFKAFAKNRLINGETLPEDLFRVVPYERASITKV